MCQDVGLVSQVQDQQVQDADSDDYVDQPRCTLVGSIRLVVRDECTNRVGCLFVASNNRWTVSMSISIKECSNAPCNISVQL